VLEKLLALLCRFCHIVEDLVVSAFPDCPAHKDNDFQGERLVNLVPEMLQVLEGIQVSLVGAESTPSSRLQIGSQ
jgi:hypothetical protein